MSWWCILRSPSDVLTLHELGEDPYDTALEAVRAAEGVTDEWEVSVSPGEPHPSLVAAASRVERLGD